MLIRRLIRKIKGIGHRWGFGVQSPFAYQFTKMLFSKPRRRYSRNTSKNIITRIQQWQESNHYNTVVTDIDERSKIENSIDNMDDDTLLIIRGIYRDKSSYRYWKELLLREKIRISFDIYYVGVISIRHGLSKHNYIINY